MLEEQFVYLLIIAEIALGDNQVGMLFLDDFRKKSGNFSVKVADCQYFHSAIMGKTFIKLF
jgi:hypothetical protein